MNGPTEQNGEQSDKPVMIFSDKAGRSQILWWLALILVFMVPISQFLSVKILVLTFLYSIFVGIRNEKNLIKFLSQAWDVYVYLLMLIIGLLYTQDLKSGWRVIETSLSFFVVPVIGYQLCRYPKWNYEKLFFSFTAGAFVACVVCFANAMFHYLKGGDINVFFFYQLTTIIDSHPTYLAYYIIFSMTFVIHLMYGEKYKIPILYFVGVVLFMFLMLMLTGGRTSFISMLLIFSFFILKFLQEPKTRIKTWTFGLVIVMVVGMFTANSIQFSGAREAASNDSWDRTKLWESAIQATPDMLLGVGTGDYKIVLNNFYLSHNLQEFADLNYNAHNQFIQILFSNGMLGLIALMLLLGRPLYLSVRYHNVLGTLTFFPFFMYAMTEVFLGRYQGVIFFAILHQAFVVHYQTSTPSFSLKISDF